jgi:DNA-binding MarR family transcriptional regulator
MIDMSTKSTDLDILLAYGRVKLKFSELAAEVFKPSGLGTLQAGIVRRLGELGTSSLAELARLACVDPAAIGRANDTLMKKGWVLRVDHPTDRRRWQVSLSPKGKKLLATVQAEYEKIAAQFSGPLNAKEKTTLLALLSKVESGLDKEALERKNHEKSS